MDAWRLSLTGAMPEELAQAPECPAGFEYLWEWWSVLCAKRPAGFGIGALPETEIQAFFNNRNIKPEPFELDLISRLDAAWITIRAEEKG